MINLIICFIIFPCAYVFKIHIPFELAVLNIFTLDFFEYINIIIM